MTLAVTIILCVMFGLLGYTLGQSGREESEDRAFTKGWAGALRYIDERDPATRRL
jgi:hypothetical protein